MEDEGGSVPANLPEEIQAGMTSEEALLLLLRIRVAEIDRHLAIFMERDDEAGPHKSRVALRRLTTVLDGFRPLFRRSLWRPLRDEAKVIFREIGRVRDAQVLLAGLKDDRRRAKLAAELIPLRDKVRRRLRQRAAVAYTAALMRRLNHGELLRAKETGQALRARPVEQLAAAAMDDLFLACRAFGPDLSALSVTELHEFRKRMKSLRYMAEFFAPLWQLADMASLRRDLQDLQDALGTLNDQAYARRRGVALPADTTVQALAEAQKLWSRLADTPAWWRGPGA